MAAGARNYMNCFPADRSAKPAVLPACLCPPIPAILLSEAWNSLVANLPKTMRMQARWLAL